MEGVGDDREDAALSDFEDEELEEAAPVELPVNSAISAEVVPAEVSLKVALAELEQERGARKILEAAKAEGDQNFARLKVLIQEAARQRDEAYRAKEETARQLEEAVQQKEDVLGQRDEFLRQRDESVRVKEEIGRARDTAKAEIGEAARLLIGANDKVTSMLSGVKSFGRSLPPSKYTGLCAIAFGFGKRMEDIVEEILRQRDMAVRTQLEVREQMEQRNYSIAIEVSELEASVMRLKEEVEKKASEADLWQKRATAKDDKFLELEQVFSEKFALAEREANSLRQKLQEVESKFQILQVDSGQHKEMLQEQSKYVSKLRKCLLELPHESNLTSASEDPVPTTSEVSNGHVDEKQSLPQDYLSGLKSLSELATSISSAWKRQQEEWAKTSHEHVSRIHRLVGQKQDAAELLTVALSEKQQVLESISDLRVELGQQQSEVERLQVSLKEAQVVAEQGRRNPDVEEENEEFVAIRAELSQVAQSRDESLSKVSALEGEVTNLRQKIGELEMALARARAEVGELRSLANSQSKELVDKSAQIQDLMMRVESSSADIEALEEEVERWKEAATEEAAAGHAVYEDLERCQSEIAVLNQQLSQLKSTGEEALLRLRSKEEIAAAAITARIAAERSLQMADERAAELRDRLEELNKQIDEADRNREYRPLGGGLFDMCWPWFRNRRRPSDTGGTHMAAEMEELLEPLV